MYWLIYVRIYTHTWTTNRCWVLDITSEYEMKCLQVALILPAGGSENDSPHFFSLSYFREIRLFREKIFETSVGLNDWIMSMQIGFLCRFSFKYKIYNN
jgi:hypothetical protein